MLFFASRVKTEYDSHMSQRRGKYFKDAITIVYIIFIYTINVQGLHLSFKTNLMYTFLLVREVNMSIISTF